MDPILQIQEIISAGFAEIRQQMGAQQQETRQQIVYLQSQIAYLHSEIATVKQQNIEIAADLKDVKRYILKVEDKNIEVLPMVTRTESDNEFGSELCAQALPALDEQVENGDAVPYGKSPSKAQIDQYTLMRMKAIGVKFGHSLTHAETSIFGDITSKIYKILRPDYAFHSWYPGAVHDFIGWLIELYFKGKEAGELVRQKI